MRLIDTTQKSRTRKRLAFTRGIHCDCVYKAESTFTEAISRMFHKGVEHWVDMLASGRSKKCGTICAAGSSALSPRLRQTRLTRRPRLQTLCLRSPLCKEHFYKPKNMTQKISLEKHFSKLKIKCGKDLRRN